MSYYGVIYVITNVENGKQYVGQTRKTAEKRWQGHIRDSQRRVECPSEFYRSLRKHGPTHFTLAVLEECADIDELNEREQHWIAELRTMSPRGYNLTSGGGSWVVCDETRQKMSASQTGSANSFYGHSHDREMIERVKHVLSEKLSGESNPFYGQKHSEEARLKMSAALTGKPMHPSTRAGIRRANMGNQYTKGRPLSAEHRAKISAAGRGRKQTDSTRAQMSATHTGMKRSEAQCKAISEALRENGSRIGSRNSAAKLTEESVRVIRIEHAAGRSYDELAIEYGVKPCTIKGVVKRFTWKHVL